MISMHDFCNYAVQFKWGQLRVEMTLRPEDGPLTKLLHGPSLGECEYTPACYSQTLYVCIKHAYNYGQSKAFPPATYIYK